MFKTYGFCDEIIANPISEQRHYRRFGSEQIISDLNKALHFEAMTFLESETLVKVDRASMANSLEVREPFLDSRVVEFAFRLPEKYKYQTGRTKVILKKVLSHYLPENLFDIPKRGFHVPNYIQSDAFAEIREWAFSKDALDASGLFQTAHLKEILDNQMASSKKCLIENVMYTLIILQLWLKENQFI